MAKRWHDIKIPLYPVNVSVWFSLEDYEADGGEDYPKDTAGACTWPRPGGADIVFSRVCTEYIAHEAVHAAWACLSAVGVKSGVGNQEPLAYMVGHICKRIDQEYEKWERKQNAKSNDSSKPAEHSQSSEADTKVKPTVTAGKPSDWETE